MPSPASVSDAGLKAFEILVRQHHRRLLAYALSLCGDEEQAEDIVQEALVDAFGRLAEFDTSKSFGAWLRGMVRLEYLELVRARREAALDGALLDSVEGVHAHWDRADGDEGDDALSALRFCLGQLAGEARRAVDLFYMQELPSAVVAARMGTDDVIMRKRLQRIREGLAECIRRRLAGSLRESGGP